MKIISLLIISLILFSCKENKDKETAAKIDKPVMIESHEKTALDDTTNEEYNSSEIWKKLCREYQGVWGDWSYLDTLKKYNSVVKTQNIFAKTIIEIRVEEEYIFTDTPFAMEPYMIDKEKYSIKINDNNTLSLVNKETGKEQKFSKFPYDTKLDSDADHYSFKYPMYKMNYDWFYGTYNMFDEAGNNIGQLVFDKYGHVKGYGEQTVYLLDSNVGEQNFISFSTIPDNPEQREYLLMDRKGNEYLFFDVKDFDWDEPFVKTNLKFKLRKLQK